MTSLDIIEESTSNEVTKEENLAVEEPRLNEVTKEENLVEASQSASLIDNQKPCQKNNLSVEINKDNTNIEDVDSKKIEKQSDDTKTESPVADELSSNKENIRDTNSKTPRSVNFKKEVNDTRSQPTKKLDQSNDDTRSQVDDIRPQLTKKLDQSYSSKNRSQYNRPIDFVDALVNSYKVETNIPYTSNNEEKKYVPKTSHTRLNPNWREHRTRRLMNKLEELSLWDREEEMKYKQAEWLREQKWEQIQDRQRNHDLCFNLMKARHESEMESAVTLDNHQNDDFNTRNTILKTLQLSSLNNVIDYDIPMPPQTLKRRVKQQLQQDQSDHLEPRTPIGRYRQFESTMEHKMDKINDKLKPDTEIMRAYGHHAYIPPVPVLFSETYGRLLTSPSSYESPSPSASSSSYRSNYLHGNERFSSPDYETKLRSYSKRDVRVPLKDLETIHSSYYDQSGDDDNISDYYPSSYRIGSGIGLQKQRSHYSPPKRTTASALYDCSMTTPRNYDEDYYSPKAYHHSTSAGDSLLKTTNNHTSIHERSLNDDLNTISRFSLETSKKILQNLGSTSGKDDLFNGGGLLKSKNSATNNGHGNNRKHVTFSEERSFGSDYNRDDYIKLGKRDGGDGRDGNKNSYSSSTKYPEIIALTSMK
ncbi:unnamed protein product [Didymodactylos carnosus]|uniref:Uncharacterized protein n=1 Tax=Didymodactylos carnosus TaxID=1234261 RepID=A0A8S2D2H7_9BILA|nr:unnamed protein product [Didymodactylos carnosus]CAF3646824.1 unnamed protein product [Didymodactylos carnosus]